MKNTSIDQYIENEIKKDPSLEGRLSRVHGAINIAIQIYNLRKKNKLTQAQLARIARVRQSNIARLENAEYNGYSKKTLEKIANALNVNLTILLVPKNQTNSWNTAFEIVNSNLTGVATFASSCGSWISGNLNDFTIKDKTDKDEEIKVDREAEKLEVLHYFAYGN
jgi:transcriptional regulator with XRE-family HTH domain